MKNLKKFVALLLAGVMAMVMLTACGGGGTGAEKEQEKEILKGLSSRPEAASLVKDGKLQNNDSKLYIETKDFLNARIEADTDAFGHLRLDSKTDGFDLKTGLDPTKEYLTVTVWSDYETAGYVAKFISLITEQIGNIKDINNNLKVDTNWVNVAVVVRTTKKGSYAAIAIQIKNPSYKGNK